MHRNQSVNVHKFAMVPNAEIPRSKFSRESTHKTTFDAGYLVPVYCDEVLPGDTFNFRATFFARMATPIYPVMDNMYLDSFFFFVPNRLIWTNWKKFMGEQAAPGDSISYVIPTLTSAAGGYPVGSIFDYFGLPTVGQVGGGNTITNSSLPLRAYNLIYNEWFRDENLESPYPQRTGDTGDLVADFAVARRGKRHDYFTSCLPWTQKGTAVSIPLGISAPVTAAAANFYNATAATQKTIKGTVGFTDISVATPNWTATGNLSVRAADGWIADLTTATAATVNQLRQSFQIQKLLERDARGGTRYIEIVKSHFGVISPDARQMRPEYLGGGTTMVNINPVPQTSGTAAGTTPQGNIAAFGTALANGHGFSYSATEHGHIIGIVCVRADLTYQQGLHRMWSRSTRYDYYFPAFAYLGEQAVLNKEIYADGSANDSNVFGYQERWAEYRYKPSQVSGLFRSTSAGTIDGWHLAQRFTALPTLNSTFIRENPPLSRVLAVGAAANGQQLIMDSFFANTVARPMPLYSVPGLIDHF